MSAYPTLSSVPFTSPVVEELNWKTDRSRFDDLGAEKRRQKWLYPRRNLSLTYPLISLVQARTLYNFYNAQKGSFTAFPFFFPTTSTYVTEYVGTGDGSEINFNLPSKLGTAYVLYSDGTELTEITDYTFVSEGGTDGADKIVLTIAAADGVRLTWSFTGYLKVRCTFAEDNLSFETFYARLVSVGVKLKGELNA